MDIRKAIDIVNEAIPISMAKPYMKADNSAQYDDLFAQFEKYGRGKPNPKRLYFPLKQSMGENENFKIAEMTISSLSNSIHRFSNITELQLAQPILDILNLDSTFKLFSKKIEKIVKVIPYIEFNNKETKDLYKRGLVRVGKRDIRIGKLITDFLVFWSYFENKLEDINKDIGIYSYYYYEEQIIVAIDSLKKAKTRYENDPLRMVSSSEKYYVVISRSPYDIAGMSTGRGWRSCTNLTDGSERRFVLTYVTGANLIAYLIKEGDWNIEKPLARRLICRYNKEDAVIEDYIFWPQEQYGITSQAFTRTVKLFCKIVNRGKDNGLYASNDDQQYWERMRKKGNKIQ